MRPDWPIYRRVAGVINECYDTEPFMFSVSESYRAFVHFRLNYKIILIGIVVFNDIFINISVLLLEETGEPVENHRPAVRHWQTLSHNAFLKELYPFNADKWDSFQRI